MSRAEDSLYYLKDEVQSHKTDKVALDGYLAEFRTALEQEIKEIERSGETVINLHGGQLSSNQGGCYQYSFQAEYMISTAPDTPCRLKLGKEYYDVTVVSIEDTTIILSSAVKLPDILGKGELETGSSILLKLLIKRIEEKAGNENPLVKRLMTAIEQNDNDSFSDRLERMKLVSGKMIHELPVNAVNGDRLNEKQMEAILSAIQRDTTFIWGPPGTGKSSVIGSIIDALYRESRSVLIVSHTNIAVDGAIEKAYDNILSSYVDNNESSNGNKSADRAFPILRVGNSTSTRDEIEENVSMKAHIAVLGKSLINEDMRLKKENVRLQAAQKSLRVQIDQYEWKQNTQIRDIKKNTVDIRDRSFSLQEKRMISLEYSKQIDMLREQHPGWEEQSRRIRSLFASSQSLTRELSEVRRKESEVRTKLDKHRLEKQSAERKNKKYRKLIAEFNRRQALSNQKESIDRLIGFINNAQSNYQTLVAEKNDKEEIIKNYKNKSGLAKVLAGRASREIYQQAERDFPGLEKKEAELKSLIDSSKKKLEELENQMIVTKEMKQSIDALGKPQNTDDLDRLIIIEEQQIDSYVGTIAKLQNTLDSCNEECQKIQRELESDGDYSEYVKLKSLKKEIEDTVAAEEQSLNILLSYNDKLIRKEQEWTASFFTFQSQADVIAELQELYDSISISENDMALAKDNLTIIEEKMKTIVLKLEKIAKEKDSLERKAILEAVVVGTTLTKTYLSDDLFSRQFDTVILDEASMAGIPSLWCACLLASHNIVIVGDYLQIAPIVRAGIKPEAKKWLGEDIFYQIGFPNICKEDKKILPANFVILDEQYRMEKDIAEVANLYYEDFSTTLKSPLDGTEEQLKKRKNFFIHYQPISDIEKDKPICMLDTRNLHAWCNGVATGRNTHSRMNMFSAVCSVELAFYLMDKSIKDGIENNKLKILIITPYRPHASFMERLITIKFESLSIDEKYRGCIRAGTVHRFQGSEAEIVIFDLVVDEPHFKVNLFLPDNEIYKERNESNDRMFNVAITRAMFKCFIIGNFEFIKKRTKGNSTARFLKRIEETNPCILDITKVFPDIRFDQRVSKARITDLKGKMLTLTGVNYYDYLLEDLRRMKKRAIIFSPFMTYDRIATLLPIFVDVIQDGKAIIVITKDPSDRDVNRSAYRKMEQQLESIGVCVIFKKGMHEKNVFIDDSVFWNGSLNTLSFTGNTGELMTRVEDVESFKQGYELLDVDYYLQVIEKKERLCPICGEMMIVKDKPDAGIFWTCPKDGFSLNRRDPYPHDGMLRCHCGAPYHFAMNKEPRWICNENGRHYKKVRLNDLRLPVMRRILDKDEYQTVKNYFIQVISREVNSPISGQKVSVQEFFRELSSNNDLFGSKKPAIEQKRITESTTSSVNRKKNVQSKQKETIATHCSNPSGNNTAQPVVQYTKEGKKIKTYPSVKQAAKAVEVDPKGIRNVLQGKQKTSGGFVWRTPDDDFDSIQMKFKIE